MKAGPANETQPCVWAPATAAGDNANGLCGTWVRQCCKGRKTGKLQKHGATCDHGCWQLGHAPVQWVDGLTTGL
eukprot:9617615-Lingulodinium_polyedra.AAC.1